MNLGYVTCSFTSKASYGSWRALTTFSSRIGTTNPIGQFHVAYATRICPSALCGSWVEGRRGGARGFRASGKVVEFGSDRNTIEPSAAVEAARHGSGRSVAW